MQAHHSFVCRDSARVHARPIKLNSFNGTLFNAMKSKSIERAVRGRETLGEVPGLSDIIVIRSIAMKSLFSFCLILFAIGVANAQWGVQPILRNPLSHVFTPIHANLFQGVGGSVAWGDYDNDGRLDLLVTGEYPPWSMTSTLYHNNGGTGNVFAPINANLWGLTSTAVAWGDYDNDGDLDLFIAGQDFPGHYLTFLYRQDSVGVFTNVAPGIPGFAYGAVAWGDYDNDGDLDLLISGISVLVDVTTIFRNDISTGGGFTDIAPGLPGVWFPSVAWGDYDSDGDLDILLTGRSDTNMVTRIYRNDGGGVFTDIHASLANVIGSATWGDYDSDGDLDILLSGTADVYGNVQIATIYRNDGHGGFVDIGAPLIPTGRGMWGDFDNDGDLDALQNGWRNMVGHQTRIYRNDGNDTFVDILEDTLLWAPDNASTCIEWGDYNGDGVLDIVRSDASVFRNDGGFPANHPPSIPAGLEATVHGDSVVLRWHRASDMETPARGLSYNIRMGTTPNGVNIVSPMADPYDGKRRITAMGNANLDTTWMIRGLRNGTYYWSVQAIDNAFAGSIFAPEGTFTVVVDAVPFEDDRTIKTFRLEQNFPNPFNPTTTIRYRLPTTEHVTLEVFDILGRPIAGLVNEVRPPGTYTVNWDASGMVSGMYLCRLHVGSFLDTKRLLLLR